MAIKLSPCLTVTVCDLLGIDYDISRLKSEAGALNIPEEKIVRKERLPWKMIQIDTVKGVFREDAEIMDLAAAAPYADWVRENLIRLMTCRRQQLVRSPSMMTVREQGAFGYTHEDMRVLLAPMAQLGQLVYGC